MGMFTIVILWQNGTSGTEENLKWPDVMTWMEGIHQTASQDLIKQLLIIPSGAENDPLRIVARQKVVT